MTESISVTLYDYSYLITDLQNRLKCICLVPSTHSFKINKHFFLGGPWSKIPYSSCSRLCVWLQHSQIFFFFKYPPSVPLKSFYGHLFRRTWNAGCIESLWLCNLLYFTLVTLLKLEKHSRSIINDWCKTHTSFTLLTITKSATTIYFGQAMMHMTILVRYFKKFVIQILWKGHFQKCLRNNN